MAAAPQPTALTLPLAWEDVLTQVQRTLEGAEQLAFQREQSQIAPADEAEKVAARQEAWHQALQALEQRMRRFTDPIRLAELEISATEEDWRAAEEAVKQWQQASERLRQGLANWAAPGTREAARIE